MLVPFSCKARGLCPSCDGRRMAHNMGRRTWSIAARTRINRQDYGLTWNALLEAGGVVVSDHVDLSIEVEAVAAQQLIAAAG